MIMWLAHDWARFRESKWDSEYIFLSQTHSQFLYLHAKLRKGTTMSRQDAIRIDGILLPDDHYLLAQRLQEGYILVVFTLRKHGRYYESISIEPMWLPDNPATPTPNLSSTFIRSVEVTGNVGNPKAQRVCNDAICR